MLGLDCTDKTSRGSSRMAAHWTTQAMSSLIAITIAFDLHHRGMIGIVIEYITSYVWSPILKYQASMNLQTNRCLLHFTARQRSCEEVMFSVTCVCHSVHNKITYVTTANNVMIPSLSPGLPLPSLTIPPRHVQTCSRCSSDCRQAPSCYSTEMPSSGRLFSIPKSSSSKYYHNITAPF